MFWTSLLGLALLLSAVRMWFFPTIETYRAELEQHASAALKLPVRIGALSARMRGFVPELVLARTAIVETDSGRPRVVLGDVRLGLDVLHWLKTREARTRYIALQGADLAFRREVDGRIVLEGLPTDGPPPPWLFGHGRFELIDSRLSWRNADSAAPARRLAVERLLIRNSQDTHRLLLRTRLLSAGRGTLTVKARLTGDPLSPRGITGRIYGKGDDLALDDGSPFLPGGDLSLGEGKADFELWSEWQDGDPVWVGGRTMLHRPVVSRNDGRDERRLTLDRLGGWFRWRRESEGWRIEMNRLQVGMHGRTWPETRLSVAGRTGGGQVPALRASMSWLALDDLHEALRSLALLNDTPLALAAEAELSGTLHDLRATYDPAAPPGRRYGLCARAEGVSWRRAGWPFGRNWAGEGCGNDGRGGVTVANGASRLEWPEHFSAPLDMTALRGEVEWEKTAGGWRLETPDLQVRLTDGSLTGRLALDWPDAPRDQPNLDARLNIEDAAATSLAVFIPRDLPTETREWLEQAFPAGRVASGALVWRGTPAAFPFAGGEGLFGGALEVHDGTLRFQPDWPPLENLDATVRFEGDRIGVKAARGTITGVGIRKAEADITQLSGTAPALLKVEGELEATLPQMLNFFVQTSFRDLPERFGKYALIDGGGELRLRLDANLSKNKTTVDPRGTLALKDARAELAGTAPAIEHIEGAVVFDPEQIRAENVRGVLLDQPVTLTSRREGGQLWVEAAGALPVKTLEKHFPVLAGHGLGGQLPYRLGLGVPWSRTAQRAKVRLDSDLLGLSANLPDPLGKAAAESRASSLEVDLREGEMRLPVDLAYGNVLHGRFALVQKNGKWTIPGGSLALGTATAEEPPEAGWLLRGRLDSLPLDAWRDWRAKNGAGGAGVLRGIDLEAAHPTWEGRDLGAAHWVFKRTTDAWEGDIDMEQAAGHVRLPLGTDGEWRLNFTRLRLPKFEKDTLERVRKESPDPATLPNFTVTSDHLFWNELDLGRLAFQTRRRADGLAVEGGEVRGDGVKADFQGQWLRSGGRDETRFDGKMTADNLGVLLTRAGKPKEVRDTPATLEWKLRWPDAPQRVATGLLEGEARLDLGKGSLPQFEPGLARALGLLNLNSVMRRLTLDFSDVLEEGFAYDHIRGSFKVSVGQAETSDFTVEGVSARIVASGRIDLPARAYQMVVTVSPHTSVVLPTIGSLAGGPLVGAAVLAAQTLVGDKLEVLTETQYALTGPWSAPEVKRISRFTPLGVFQEAWDGMKDLSGLNTPEAESPIAEEK